MGRFVTRSARGAALSSLLGAAVLAGGVLAGGVLAGPAALAGTTTGTDSAAAAGTGGLNGMTAVSAKDLWAVGFSYTGSTYSAMTENYNGTAWSIVPSPSPTGASDTYLYGASAVSASNVWSVGYSMSGSTASPLAEQWNGTSWKIVPTPAPSGAAGAYLYAVDAVSASNVWAVGYAQPSFTTLIEHWNGKKWAIVPSPNPSGASGSWLYGIDGTSATDVWAVGYWSEGLTTSTLAEHWNGTSWTITSSPSPGGQNQVTSLEAVHAIGASNAWGVGFLYDGPVTETVTEHWNGTSWSAKPSADPGGSATSLVAVGAGSYKDVWAVGDATNNSTSVTTTVAEQWNGTAWKILPTPNPTGSKDASLTGVSVISAASAWAVGYSWNGTATSTVIEHWNGTTWKLTKAPS